MNKYIKFLYNKRAPWTIAGIRNNLAIRRFKKKCIRSSPSFNQLWEIADFIKYLEFTYFYDNTINTNGLYSSSKGYSPGTNGFTVRTNEVWVKIKLFSNNQGIAIEVDRLKGNKNINTITLVNGDWADDHDQYDEVLLNNIIGVLWEEVFNLFTYYYKERTDYYGSYIEHRSYNAEQ